MAEQAHPFGLFKLEDAGQSLPETSGQPNQLSRQKRPREEQTFVEYGIYKFPPKKRSALDLENKKFQQTAKGPAELKTREICRVIYPLNASGSKQIIIAMDPDDNFFPVITIGKPGWSGYQLSVETFECLVKNVQFISDYFNNPSEEYTTLQLSASDLVTFRKNWGKHLICISNVLDSSLQVTIAKSTWDCLVDILPLLTDVMNMYQRWQSDAFYLFVALAKRLKQCLPSTTVMNLPIIEDKISFQNTLRGIDFYSLDYEGQHDTMLNLQRLFREMQYFCAEYLASYIPCLDNE